MPIRSSRVAVATVPKSLLPAVDNDGDTANQTVMVKNPTANGAAIFVGGPDVTAGTGFEVGPGETVSMDVVYSAPPFAIAVSGSLTVHVMQVGV